MTPNPVSRSRQGKGRSRSRGVSGHTTISDTGSAATTGTHPKMKKSKGKAGSKRKSEAIGPEMDVRKKVKDHTDIGVDVSEECMHRTEEEQKEENKNFKENEPEIAEGRSMASSSASHTYVPLQGIPSASLDPTLTVGELSFDENRFLHWADNFSRASGLRAMSMSEALHHEETDWYKPLNTRDAVDTSSGNIAGIATDDGSTAGMATAAVLLMGGEEAGIRESLMQLRQWLMASYRLTEERCMQFQNSANATGRNKTVKEASIVLNRENGALQHGRQENELRSQTFEAFLSGTTPAPSFGFGSNVNVVVASPRETSLHTESGTPYAQLGLGSRVEAMSALKSTARPRDKPPSHSAIFSGLGTSPQCALEAIKSSFGTLGKIQTLAMQEEGMAASKRTRR